jgi:Transglycosylase-like domain
MAGGLPVFMHAERIQESRDNYHAYNSGSGAAGAYQFLPGTWSYAISLAGLSNAGWQYVRADGAPPSVQDAAAAALMGHYYNQFGHSWYNVAEAWYGGPGAVGHPDWGGGPGYPNVGQYASSVVAIYNRLGGTDTGGPIPGVPQVTPFSPGFQSSYTAFFIQVIEPMGRTWRAYSRGLPWPFYSVPRKVA